MNRTLLTLLISLAIRGALAQGQAPVQGADSLRSVLSGTVRDSLGFPVTGASVMITPGSLIYRTDSAGRFVARGVPAGRLGIMVRRLGFSPLQSQTTMHVGMELTMDLVMRRLPQVLAEVEVRAEQDRQCPRYSLEGVLCRREVGHGQFMNRQDIVATKAIFPWLVLRDMPGFRQNLNGDPRTIESITGWRCIQPVVDGRLPSAIDRIPRVRDMFAVEVYQPNEVPPEYQHLFWRGEAQCTLVVFWTNRVGRQKLRSP